MPSKIDGIVIFLFVVVTFISSFDNVFSGFSEAILLGPVLGLGYYLGKKYLFNNTKIEEER